MNSQSSSKTVTSYSIILVVAGAHLINDLIQFLVPALYPLFKDNFDLSYLQLGLITLAQQITACVLQPVMGLYGDMRPKPLTLAVSLIIVAVGVFMLATASSFALLLAAAAVLGVGSALFHPEASRVSRMASGGRLGFAQSTFQVGGNTGTALGPLAVVLLVLPLGQSSILWFVLLATLGVIMLVWVARWYANHQRMLKAQGPVAKIRSEFPRKTLIVAFAVIGALLLSKFVYIETFKSYYNFFLIEKFGLEVGEAQTCLFIFLSAVAFGTFFGGPVGDRLGHLKVIWVSILGALPFRLAASSRESVRHRRAECAGRPDPVLGLLGNRRIRAGAVAAESRHGRRLVFGFAFGIGALGAAALGALADYIGIPAGIQLFLTAAVARLSDRFLPKSRRMEAEAEAEKSCCMETPQPSQT